MFSRTPIEFDETTSGGELFQVSTTPIDIKMFCNAFGDFEALLV